MKVNTDQYYHFVYNQKYRMANRLYYQQYSRNYNKNNNSSVNSNSRKYRLLNKLNNTKGPIIEYIDGYVKIEWT